MNTTHSKQRKEKELADKKQILWSPELAYCIGNIVADGEVSPDGSHIQLSSKDRDQVQNVKDFLHIQAKITAHSGTKLGTGKPQYKLRWKNKILHEFLVGIGFRPYKSLSLAALKIPDKYFFDFLRGYQDGDSCFSSYFDPYWKENNLFWLVFSSVSLEYALWLKETIDRLAGVNGNIARTGKTTRMSNLKYSKKEAIVLLSRLQLSSVIVPQTRKKLKINRALAVTGVSFESN